ncbi:MAG: hypothetical protein KJ630_00400 [Proteobacteria bacterium]|nr:hypothetical protein [Pseudomonadota bacterium]
MEFKDLWDLESAMKILTHETVDGKVWAEAVKWLILHGPVEIRQLLLDASSLATSTSFPGLKPSYYTSDGQPFYDIKDLAKSLDITEIDIRELLKQKESEFAGLHFVSDDSNETIH